MDKLIKYVLYFKCADKNMCLVWSSNNQVLLGWGDVIYYQTCTVNLKKLKTGI